MKVGLLIFQGNSRNSILRKLSSTPTGSLLHHEQPYLSVSGRLYCDFQSSGVFGCYPVSSILDKKRTMQLTSLSALQSSLDILRKHRPDYTPRTGFVWPITDPSAVLETNKKRQSDSMLDEDADMPQEAKQSDIPKRQQNNMLLRHAMNTTAAHSKITFTTNFSAQGIDVVMADTPVTTTMRSSVTPAPQAPPDPAAKGSTGTLDASKGPAGGGKKKKKRMSTS